MIPDPLTPEVKSAPLPKEVQPISEPAHSQPAIVNERSPPILSSTPKQEISYVLIESFTVTNQQLVAGSAKQSLPKCQPDILDGDVTLFHPWKSAFKAVIRDAEVPAKQEMNYLRSNT